MAFDLIVRGGELVLEGRGVVAGDLGVTDGKIAAIATSLPAGGAAEEIDARGLHVLPGAIDSHTHWGYRAEFAVDAHHDSRAAAIGGTTTAHVLLQHHLPSGDLGALKAAAEAESVVDFAMAPLIRDEASVAMIPSAVEEWGCTSFKFYLARKKVAGAAPGEDWNELTDGLMLEALHVMAKYDDTVAFVHAENPEISARYIEHARASKATGLAGWELGNPSISETEAIQRAAVLCEQAGVPLFIVHLSGRDALEAVRRVRRDWPNTYIETCPHYLFHNVEGSSEAVKFSPPVRFHSDNDALWEGIRDGTVNCIGSDNTPTSSAEKKGDVWSNAKGGPGAGILLPLLLSEGIATGRVSLNRVAEVTATNAAKVLGLYPAKGVIGLGSDADLAIVDLKARREVEPQMLGIWADYTLYDNVTLQGWPVATLVRGQPVVRDGELVPTAGIGRYLPRGRSYGGGATSRTRSTSTVS